MGQTLPPITKRMNAERMCFFIVVNQDHKAQLSCSCGKFASHQLIAAVIIVVVVVMDS